MAEGETTFEWMEGGFFLIQRGTLHREGKTHTVLEIIGYERGIGSTEPASEITSRAYTSNGDTVDYTYETDEETLTMWMGPKDSPAGISSKVDR
jgi:hypothetical protein